MSAGAEDKTSQLLADIEAFSRHGPAVDSEGPSVPAVHRETLAFPDLSKPASEKAVPPAPTSAASPTLEAPSSLGQVQANSLLARLKQQAHSLQQDEGQRDKERELRAQILSATLGAAFHYVDDLIKQLNIIKPPVPKEYLFPGNIVFSGMSWVEGAADFRMVPSASEDRRYESLSARFRLAAAKNIVVERDAIGIEPFRKTLHDHNIVFKIDEKRNARNLPESARFTFPCEIKAGFLIKADSARGDFVLRTRNIDRFGMMEFRLPVETLNHETLDELAQLFLGAKSRFLQMFRRSA
ncbi:MAG: hypothetical protein N2690_04580 [Rhodocyclaceae bacterium]|nr:hypothetical protein [Rhodocyclaceae bacterium]